MFKNLQLIICLCFISFSYSQKSYEFDYVAEYKVNYRNIHSKNAVKYEFFNSKDNSYMLSVFENTENVDMWLILKSGQFYHGQINREDFFVEAISLKCPRTWFKRNSDFESLKDYEVKKLNDTVINTDRYNMFVVKPLNEKDIKEKKLQARYYVVDNSGKFSFPFVEPTGLLYRKWKKDGSIPNGLIKEIYLQTAEVKDVITELVQYVATKKLILIDMDCR